MDDEPMECTRSESEDHSNRKVDARDDETEEISMFVPSPVENLDDIIIKRQHPISFESVAFMNQAELMHSKTFSAITVYSNANRTNASENYAGPGTSRSLKCNGICPFELLPASYREMRSFSSNSSESFDSKPSTVSPTDSPDDKRLSLLLREEGVQNSVSIRCEYSENSSHSRVPQSKMYPGNIHTLAHECEIETQTDYKGKVIQHFLDTMVSTGLSSEDSSPEKYDPFRQTDKLDEEYFSDTKSPSSIENQQGTANSYKFFSQIDHKDVHSALPNGSLSNTGAMEAQLYGIIQGSERSPQSDKVNINWSDFSDSYEDCSNKTEMPKPPKRRLCFELPSDKGQVNASNSHHVSFETQRTDHIKRLGPTTSHVNKPIVLKRTRHGSTPELREINVSKQETFRKSAMDKSQSFSDLKIEPKLTAEGESADGSRDEQCSGKRKLGFSKDSSLDGRKEKFLKTI